MRFWGGHKHLPESPVAAVSQEGCEVRSWKLQPSLCLQHPPCNCGGGKAKTQLAVRLSVTLSNTSLCHWCKLFSKEKNNWKGPKCYPHNGVDSSTVTFPHAPEARLTTDVPYLRGEERSLNAQALQRWARSCRPEPGQSANDFNVIYSIIIYYADIPLLSRCLWWPSACWSQPWESCLHWTDPTVAE